LAVMGIDGSVGVMYNINDANLWWLSYYS
jgi:hypothetical protein